MAGHMGFRKVTIHNLEVVEVNNEDGILCIKGAVPGSKGSFVVIRDAIKPKSLTVKIKKVVEEVEESSKEKKASDIKKEDKKESTVVKNDNKGEKK